MDQRGHAAHKPPSVSRAICSLVVARDGLPAPRVTVPGDTFIFVPADHGERHLLRIAAKYGPQKLGLSVTTGGESR